MEKVIEAALDEATTHGQKRHVHHHELTTSQHCYNLQRHLWNMK
jgi:hypothetical protein